jgi:hypothetical protein
LQIFDLFLWQVILNISFSLQLIYWWTVFWGFTEFSKLFIKEAFLGINIFQHDLQVCTTKQKRCLQNFPHKNIKIA